MTGALEDRQVRISAEARVVVGAFAQIEYRAPYRDKLARVEALGAEAGGQIPRPLVALRHGAPAGGVRIVDFLTPLCQHIRELLHRAGPQVAGKSETMT